MSGRRGAAGVAVRRIVQLVFLAAFLGLVLLARPQPGADPSRFLQSFFLVDPLILAATWIAAHAVPAALLWALGVVALTVVLGRVFCGWVCPMGTLHAIAGRALAPRRRKPDPARDHWSPWHRAKYYLLAGFLAMAVFGGHWVTVFDPLVMLYRTVTTALLPGAQWAVEQGSKAVYDADLGVGRVRLHDYVTEPPYRFLRDHVFVVSRQAFLGGGLIVAVFGLTLALNRWRPRFWCRYLCPLGALLGLLAWRPFLRRTVRKEDCNQCDLCGMTCGGGASGSPGDQWRPSECFGCLNCTRSCARQSLGFTWQWPWRKEPRVEPIDLSRRATLAAAAGGVATLAFLRANPQARGTTYHPALIRPPGARSEREFLARCTGCGMCMKVCPTGGLQPTLFEAGLEGIWTPRLVPQIGYCDHMCNRCGQVCPTQAIEALSIEEKQSRKIGLAAFDTTRCIPYAYGTDCIVCEEHCPIPEKAIYAVEVEVTDRNGQKKTILQPHVDPQKCIGCGVCENVCPYQDRPGIRVTSANESRHEENQPVSASGSDSSPYP
ncbi:MAG: 4Fe-4S dicluster domain-containing protein [Thermoguttaceae bacterium]|jgi:polyferredoxin|nr:4Fe-4S dicluster domain-containing protein [Thermoguttaceae bacterium]